MKIDEQLLRKTLSIRGSDNLRIVINGHYYCSFLGKNMDAVDPSYCVFNESWREKCFPSLAQYADVYVYDDNYKHGKSSHRPGFGKLYHMKHIDSCTDSFFLMLEDKTMVEAVEFKLEDELFPLRKFISLINEKPIYYDVKEPYESNGLSIVEFEMISNTTATIEYDINGCLYFEVVDWNGVDDGEVLSLDSDRRKFVINYVKLTKENVEQLVDHINRALEKRKTLVVK